MATPAAISSTVVRRIRLAGSPRVTAARASSQMKYWPEKTRLVATVNSTVASATSAPDTCVEGAAQALHGDHPQQDQGEDHDAAGDHVHAGGLDLVRAVPVHHLDRGADQPGHQERPRGQRLDLQAAVALPAQERHRVDRRDHQDRRR